MADTGLIGAGMPIPNNNASQGCTSCASKFNSISCPNNLSLASFDQIWALFADQNQLNVCNGSNPCLFEYLLPFSSLSFREQRTTLYQLYLLTRPTSQSSPDYEKLVERSITVLLDLLWRKLIDFLDVPLSQQNESRDELMNGARKRTIDQIEKDVQKLYDSYSTWLELREIYKSYGFSTPEDNAHIGKALTRFSYDRKHHGLLSPLFLHYYVNDRRRSNFAASIFQSTEYWDKSSSRSIDSSRFSKRKVNTNYHQSSRSSIPSSYVENHSCEIVDSNGELNGHNRNYFIPSSSRRYTSGEAIDFARRVNLDYIYDEFKQLTFDWPIIKEIESLSEVLVREGEDEYRENERPNLIQSWNLSAFTVNKEIKNRSIPKSIRGSSRIITGSSRPINPNFFHTIVIEECDWVLFETTDGIINDLIETDITWRPLRCPRYYVKESDYFREIIQFRKAGTFYLRSNHYPQIIRLRVIVKPSTNIDKCFDKILTSDLLLPHPHIPGYKFTSKFKRMINQFILAESILRCFTWSFLRTFTLANHSGLVQRLSINQLKTIHQAQSLCDIMMIIDKSPVWETLISNIGDILMSRLLRDIAKCDSNCNLDLRKETISRWYINDHDFAIVAMCNAAKADGSIDACSVARRIKVRLRSGV